MNDRKALAKFRKREDLFRKEGSFEWMRDQTRQVGTTEPTEARGAHQHMKGSLRERFERVKGSQ